MIWSILYNFFDIVFLSSFVSFTFFFPFIYCYISFKSPVSFLWCSCTLYMVLLFFTSVSWFYFMFKNNNFLSYFFFDKFVIFFVVLFLMLVWFSLRFVLRDVISLLRASVILSLILKDAVSKILLHSFFNWMLRVHNERLNFNFKPLGYFFDLL